MRTGAVPDCARTSGSFELHYDGMRAQARELSTSAAGAVYDSPIDTLDSDAGAS